MSQEDLISEFRSIADVSEERARFFLESAAWQLPVALSSFFDSGASGAPVPLDEENMDEDYEPPAEDAEDTDKVPAYNTKLGDAKPEKASGSTRTTRSSNFSSIKDFVDEEQEDEDEGQRYYAGGSEHSGELIVGPPRKKTNKEITKDLFAEAKKHGAESVEPGDRSSTKKNNPKYFTGGGYKLGETKDNSQFVAGSEVPEERGPINVVLKLWSNGFTVDDGPIREFDDPANAEFLNSVKKGQIPQELLKGAKRGEVHVDMEDHRQEEYKAPKKKLKPFSGQGHMLGSPTPAVSFGAAAASVPQTSSVDPPVQVDQSQPTTNIQIRLANGQRLVHKFNHTHRVRDIRTFVISKNPEMANQSFILMTTFPNKELTDDEQTISDANLLNAAIVQRYK